MRMQEALRIFLLVNLGLFILGTLRFAYLRMHLPLFEDGEIQDGRLGEILRNKALCPEATCNCDQKAVGNIPVSDYLLHNRNQQEEEFQVPNIVHYIWFNTEPRPLQFHHMLSVLSAHRILNPDVIYFHTNMEPTGKYWNLVKRIPTVQVNYREPPTTLFGEKIKEPLFYTSHSNVDRVKILMEYGGIYLDFDTLVTKPFDELRKHPCTIAQETETKACGCVIVCSKHSLFLTLWINAYIDDYRVEEWAYNTGQVPFNLARRFPHLVNVNKRGLVYPSYRELEKIWGPESWPWWENFSVHLYYRLWKDTSPYYEGIEPDEHNVKTWNNSFGQMARTILYGTKDLMHREDYFKIQI